MSLMGKTAYIKNNVDSFHAGGWGVIEWYRKGEYHIAMYGDKYNCAVFARDEFVVRREKGGRQ